ncbi:MAG: hypothetical protein SD837_00055 [Candidatus Electrothrix scaldis]|nr:MAG: hypothetical protein SD837_00055 [Candidatus Electrothrix sp. GW3-3]
MELKDFISETLTQLVEGIADAQSRVDGKGGRVCPYTYNKPEHKSVIAKTKDNLPVVAVDFDVLITAEDGTGTKGNVSVVAGIFNLGSQGESKHSNQSASRVKFMVPVALPLHGSLKE